MCNEDVLLLGGLKKNEGYILVWSIVESIGFGLNCWEEW